MLSLSYSAACAAGQVALRSLGQAAQRYGAVALEARRMAVAVGARLDDLGEAADATDRHDPVSLAYDASQRDHAFARGDLRGYQESLHQLADDATAEVERVRELALVLPLAGQAGTNPLRPLTPAEAQAAYDAAEPVPVSKDRVEEIVRHATNGTVELMNGEPVAPCEREDPAALTGEEAAEIIAAALLTLEATLAAEKPLSPAGEELVERFGYTPNEVREFCADERALGNAHLDESALKRLTAALPPAVEAPPAPLAVEAELKVEAPGKKPRAKGRGKAKKGG